MRRRRIPSSIRLPSRWHRGWPGVVTTLILVGLVAWNHVADGPDPSQDHARYHDQTCRVVHVVDGDTFDIDIADSARLTTRIRLWGVDAPEIAHGSQPRMHFGEEARNFATATLVQESVRVVLAPRKTRDKYGRLLAYVYVSSGEMFNEQLIERGLAYADFRFSHSYKQSFESLDRGARKSKVGLWASANSSDLPAWRRRMESQP